MFNINFILEDYLQAEFKAAFTSHPVLLSHSTSRGPAAEVAGSNSFGRKLFGVTLSLPIMYLGDLTPVQHSKLTTRLNGPRYVIYVRPSAPLCATTVQPRRLSMLDWV